VYVCAWIFAHARAIHVDVESANDARRLASTSSPKFTHGWRTVVADTVASRVRSSVSDIDFVRRFQVAKSTVNDDEDLASLCAATRVADTVAAAAEFFLSGVDAAEMK